MATRPAAVTTPPTAAATPFRAKNAVGREIQTCLPFCAAGLGSLLPLFCQVVLDVDLAVTHPGAKFGSLLVINGYGGKFIGKGKGILLNNGNGIVTMRNRCTATTSTLEATDIWKVGTIRKKQRDP